MAKIFLYSPPAGHDFTFRQVSQNMAILSIVSGVRFTVGLNTSTPASHPPSNMTLGRCPARQARAASLNCGPRFYQESILSSRLKQITSSALTIDVPHL